MIKYKRTLTLGDIVEFTNENGELGTLPKNIQIFLTQNIEDIGIYNDNNEGLISTVNTDQVSNDTQIR